MDAVIAIVRENFWGFFTLAVVWIFRRELASLVGRAYKARLKFGNSAEAEIEATPIANQGAAESIAKSEPPPSSVSSPGQDEQAALAKEEEIDGNDFWRAYKAIQDRQLSEADALFTRHLRTLDDSKRRFEDQALYLSFRIREGGDQESVPRLASLHAQAANDEQLNLATGLLVGAYNRMKDYENAEEVLRKSIDKVGDEGIRTRFLTALAALYGRKGRTEEGVVMLIQRLNEVCTNNEKYEIYSAIADLEKSAGRLRDAAIALEKAVEANPGNTETLFSAAYLQSEQALGLLSVANYETLLVLDKDNATAMNNLGVVATEFKVLGKSMSSFISAAERKLSLAMANIAGHKIDIGMYDEAEKLLNDASQCEDVHENVAHKKSQLETARRADEEKWKKVSTRAVEFQRRIRVFGSALFVKEAPANAWVGTWYTKTGHEVDVTFEGKTLAGKWAESSLAAIIGNGEPDIACSIMGIQRGRAAEVAYKRKSPSSRRGLTRPSLLDFGSNSSTDKAVSLYSYLSEDHQQWVFFSAEIDSEHSFQLTRAKP